MTRTESWIAQHLGRKEAPAHASVLNHGRGCILANRFAGEEKEPRAPTFPDALKAGVSIRLRLPQGSVDLEDHSRLTSEARHLGALTIDP